MNYSREKAKRKATSILMALVAATVIGAAGYALSRDGQDRKAWDAEYPLTNANVSWQQTYYGGGRK